MTIASDIGRPSTTRGFWLGVAAYLMPTFLIAFVWHLVLFEPNYHALRIYTDNPIIPFGFASMVIQGIVFSWVFPRIFGNHRGSVLIRVCSTGSVSACCHGCSPRWRLRPSTRCLQFPTMSFSKPALRSCSISLWDL
jgi:hypothetical protein